MARMKMNPGRRLTTAQIMYCGLGPMRSRTIRRLIADGMTPEDASVETERLRDEWAEWDEADGPRWRFWNGHAHNSDERWLAGSGLSLDEVLRGDVPEDPPRLWTLAAA